MIDFFTAVLVTGGSGSFPFEIQKTSTIIDIANDQASSGPDLIVARKEHGCNTIEIGTKKYAIILGGKDASFARLSSTELLDLDQLNQGSWIAGPNFPTPMSQLSLVSTSPTSLFAIGGFNAGKVNDKVHKFTCTGTTVDTCQWVEHQTLQNGRYAHVAIPLTDAWVTQLC